MKASSKALLFPLLILVSSGLAQDSGNVIPFQGQLADQSGQPLTPASPVTIVFRLYQTPVGGVAVWEEQQPNISVNAGRFTVLLGSRKALPAYTNFNATLYLGLTVDDGNPATTDVEMRPRQALVPVISASYAKEADKLDGYDWSILFGPGNSPATSPLLDSRIADGSIQANKIKPRSIHAGLIVSNTITGGLIQPGTITPEQISRDSLTLSALAQEVMDRLVPAGTIVAFGGHTNKIPRGWLLCNGRPVSSGEYGSLYSMIHTNWGAGVPNSTNDFNVPDLRGMFIRGVNSGRSDGYQDINAGGRVNAVPVGGPNTGGLVSGNSGSNVGSVQEQLLPSHRHRWGTSDAPSVARERKLRSWNAAGSAIDVLVDAIENNLDSGGDVRDNFKQVVPVNGSLYTEPGSLADTVGRLHPINAAVHYLIKH